MSGLPIILFVDPSMIYKFRIFPIKVIGLSLTDLEMYQMAMAYKGDLPSVRTSSKDTKEFYALMNSKIEFVKRAAILYPSEKFMWIDFGILKIFKNPIECIERLQELEKQTFTKIKIPGCWAPGRFVSHDTINWTYCGGFLIIPSALIDEFYNHCKGVLRDFCTMPQYKLTWETNIWAIVSTFAMKDTIEWFSADHNDSMIMHVRY